MVPWPNTSARRIPSVTDRPAVLVPVPGELRHGTRPGPRLRAAGLRRRVLPESADSLVGPGDTGGHTLVTAGSSRYLDCAPDTSQTTILGAVLPAARRHRFLPAVALDVRATL